jgi:NTE family protein
MTAPLLALSPGNRGPRWFSPSRVRARGAGARALQMRIRTLKRRLEQRRGKGEAVGLTGAISAAESGIRTVSAADLRSHGQEAGGSEGYDLALVLSGGGARGFAHVGVLQVVEELRLPVDLVVGVSMGSIIGAGYAAGLTADQMADLARAMRIPNVFRPRPGRLNLVDPAGIQDVISRIFGSLRFEDLERQMVVVSSSMTTGQHVVIRSGPIVDAIVSSCSIPLVFPPVSRDGHLLLDGGLIDGLPIAVARELGARRIVAVDASTHARHVLRLPVVRHATRGVVKILDRRRPRADLDAMRIFSRVLHHATLHPARPPVELLIRPTFGRRSTLHYHRWPDIVACGRAAAEVARPELLSLLTTLEAGQPD